MEFNLLAIDNALHLTTGTDGDGIHRHMGSMDFSKLLDAVDHHDIVVRIADLNVLIVG